MQTEDLEQVQAIDVASFSLPWPASAFRYELLESDHSDLWVAASDPPANSSRVLGAIVSWRILDEAHIATLAVHPEYRRMGIAQALLATCLSHASRNGIRTATLEVRAGNLAAQQLYLKFNFQIVGRRGRYYQDNQEDAILMTLTDMNRHYLDWLDARMRKLSSFQVVL
jgi:ribosomal-protein-alanine N-acetyltransferase